MDRIGGKMARKKIIQQTTVEDILEPKKSSKPIAEKKKRALLPITNNTLTAKDISYYFSVLIPNEVHKASMSEKEMFDKINMLCHKYNVKERVSAGCGGKKVSDVVKKIVEAYNNG